MNILAKILRRRHAYRMQSINRFHANDYRIDLYRMRIPDKRPLRIPDNELDRFIGRLSRAEWDEAGCHEARIMCKAVRATLHALGYDHNWIEGKVRDAIEREYGLGD